jgi:primosomal protein N''
MRGLFQRCFDQGEFEENLQISTKYVEEQNTNLKSLFSLPGFLMTPKEPAFAHFATHDIDERALSFEFTVQVVNKALLAVKNKYNLTKSQLRTCIKRENIHINDFCTPLKIECDPATTK